MSRLTSAKGLLSLLQETDAAVLQFALNRLNGVVDEFWYELTGQLSLLEELSESVSLPENTRQSAALLASRTYFHLNACDDSVQFALAAGKLFSDACAQARTGYTDTILGRCIDLYVAHREKHGGRDAEGDKSVEALDPRLEAMFESIAANWVEDAASDTVREVIGFTLRARRADLLEAVLRRNIEETKSAEILSHCLRVANSYVTDIVFRTSVLRCLAGMYTSGLRDVDYFALVECLLFLQDAKAVARLIVDLLKTNKIVAYQLAFDLFDTANQDFLHNVLGFLAEPAPQDTPAQDDDAAVGTSALAVDPNVTAIMTGELTAQLYLKFLYSQCKADVHVLSHIKKVIPTKVAVLHSATVIASALMYSGTTIDGFLRDNLQWLGKLTNWAKFTATASVGAIHKGHVDEALTILEPYLPQNDVGALPFQEAGALYAYGLIHSGLGASPKHKDAVTYIRGALSQYAAKEEMVHGASLGLGLAAMGMHDQELVDALFVNVASGAVAGEAAALGMGLVMLGSGDMNTATMMMDSARDDQKEKTARGLVMGIALTMLGREAMADPIIDALVVDRDSWVRVGGCYTIGMAYAATGNAAAVERLLSVGVKDVNSDVKRTAVMMIGFICLKDPARTFALVKAFADSYNPHIRYGVAMAVAVAAAGTGDEKIVHLLWELKDDTVDFVRQGAYIALAMVLVQQTGELVPRAKDFRALLSKTASDNKVDVCTRFGAILATGLLDAGGRNCTIGLHRNGHARKNAVVGVFLFLQYWYWFPYSFMVTLALQPTCVIGLTENLTMPHYTLKSNAPPSTFALPPSVLQEKKEAKAAAAKAAVLSTTQKHQQHKAKKAAAAGMSQPTSPTAPKDEPLPEKEEEKKDAVVATEELLQNPARVVAPQLRFLDHTVDGRYRPLKPKPGLGICMLTDTDPSKPEDLVAVDLTAHEVKPPESFTWP